MTANELDLDATLRELDAIQATWAEIQNTPAPGLVTDRLICAEQSAADVPRLIAKVKQLATEVRRLRSELASREPQILAEKPGPNVTEVYDRDGHPWARNRNTGLWCAFGVDVGVPTSWESLVRVWGQITVKGVGR
ncbi:hypothetical protein ACGFIY_21030 [Micromonospora chersina]|uniref:hypothetical protein n=1 Tax=Micromonospora chersina TaxID=47854 RepID=UPI00371A87FA